VDGSSPGVAGNSLPDRLDADSTWALVFRDDNACLYVRRAGRYSDLARREGYVIIPGASDNLSALGQACARDPRVRVAAYQELLRQLRSSRFNARASSLLANLDLMDGRGDLGSTRLRHALDLNPGLFTLHERLGLIAFRAGHVRDALREFDLEAGLGAGLGGGQLQLHRGQALEALGRRKDALEAYTRQLAQSPDDSAEKAALQRLQSPR
jgi:tetratricopeptide (TPR) repeat protein